MIPHDFSENTRFPSLPGPPRTVVLTREFTASRAVGRREAWKSWKSLKSWIFSKNHENHWFPVKIMKNHEIPLKS